MKNRSQNSSTELPLELDEFLCFSVYSANHAFNRLYHPLLQEIGLTYPQFITMILLWSKDGQTVGEIGEKLYLQSNTVTPMLKRLEALGYVERSRNPQDERQVHINLTDAGRKLRIRASGIVRKVRIATRLPEKQMKALVNEVGTLRKALEGKISE